MIIYSHLKALHLIFITTWFSGLFYLVRLFIYHREAQEGLESPSSEHQRNLILIDQYSIMQKRLWFGITCPSCILVFLFGLLMLPDVWGETWFYYKLPLLILLTAYHLYCGSIRKQLATGSFTKSSLFLRYYNELATVFLVSIVFIAILKDQVSMLKALIIFVVISLLLFAGVKSYKNFRSK